MEKYISKEAFKKIKTELKELKEKRKDIAERLKKSASYGDLTENAEYQQAREDKELLEKKISEIENKIKNLKIKKQGLSQSKKAGPYSKLKVKNKGEIIDIILVSPEEIDFLEGKISYESPLGKVLLDKEKGNQVKVSTPSGEEFYEILEIIN